ncbi:hypothetical protein NQ315_017594 [Exocentrus adspersus]|uniref:HAT C-terminal dimerisation domain-containing protein n=1 Tax=Exocentrus adspersus TaxID=1586481 RepID=A0AAV8V6E0_9CUCU|nr:hypothetical protein NQ315_017594 [Exocentrus adspersus]
MTFSSEQSEEFAKNIVTGLVRSKIPEKRNTMGNRDREETQRNPNESDDENSELSVWGAFRKKAAGALPKGSANSQAIIEIQRYLEDELLPRNEDPSKWWKKHQYHYPYLSKVFREKGCALATSVPCERLFPKQAKF